MYRIETFKNELDLINDQDCRRLAEELLKHLEHRFFTLPSSSTGKYHPVYEFERGGLVIHTKAVVYFVNQFNRANLFTSNEYLHDLAIVAALAHDMKKYGEFNHFNYTVKDHPILAVNYVKKIAERANIKLPLFSLLLDMIECHGGAFGERKPYNEITQMLHIADYVASRRECHLSCFVNHTEETKEEDQNP